MADSRESLFETNEAPIPKVRNMTIGPVSGSDVEEFARRYHYTGTGGNMSWRWGLWNGPVLHGVVAYNLPTRSVCESVFGAEHFDKVWHMGRLILSEESPRNSESRLIGGSLREIERQYNGDNGDKVKWLSQQDAETQFSLFGDDVSAAVKIMKHAEQADVWGVLTYAAIDAGHIGTVYQATNALYTGLSSTEHHYIDKEGHRRSSYLGGRRVLSDRAESMGWTRREGQPKHRYLYILGDKRQRRDRLRLLKYPVLPYPKKEHHDTRI